MHRRRPDEQDQADFRNVARAAVAGRARRRSRLRLRPGADRRTARSSARRIAEQTTQVLENVKAALALAGCTMDDVVKCLVILTDAKEFAELQQGLRDLFPEGPAGAHDARGEPDDRHQGRDRGDRLQAALSFGWLRRSAPSRSALEPPPRPERYPAPAAVRSCPRCPRARPASRRSTSAPSSIRYHGAEIGEIILHQVEDDARR